MTSWQREIAISPTLTGRGKVREKEGGWEIVAWQCVCVCVCVCVCCSLDIKNHYMQLECCHAGIALHASLSVSNQFCRSNFRLSPELFIQLIFFFLVLVNCGRVVKSEPDVLDILIE